MSLYNLIAGMNAGLALVASPFLPRRADKFPRFRDIFTEADDTDLKGDLYVYTRMGGGNRECWENDDTPTCDCGACDAERIEESDQCVGSYEDEFDRTYRTFVFKIADEDRADWETLKAGNPAVLSDAYVTKLQAMFADDGENTQAFITGLVNARRALKEA